MKPQLLALPSAQGAYGLMLYQLSATPGVCSAHLLTLCYTRHKFSSCQVLLLAQGQELTHQKWEYPQCTAWGMGSAEVLLTAGEGPRCSLASFGARRECQRCGTEILFTSRSPGNGQASLGVTGRLAVGGKELISSWVERARNWVWVN